MVEFSRDSSSLFSLPIDMEAFPESLSILHVSIPPRPCYAFVCCLNSPQFLSPLYLRYSTLSSPSLCSFCMQPLQWVVGYSQWCSVQLLDAEGEGGELALNLALVRMFLVARNKTLT